MGLTDMASAEKRGNTWRARYIRLDGSKGSEGGYPSKAAAIEAAEAIEADLRRGLIVDPRLSSLPLRDWVAEWRAQVADSGATAANRRYRLDNWIVPTFGDVLLRDITWFAVKTWVTGLLRSGRFERATADSILSTFSSVLTGAVDAGLLTSNPLYRRGLGGSGGAHEPVWVEPEQAYQLYTRLGPPYDLMVLLGAWCGLRWGEMCALHVDNVLQLRARPARHVIVIDRMFGALHEIGDTGGEAHVPPARVPRGTPPQTSRLYLGPPKPPSGPREVDVPEFLARIISTHIESWPYPYLCLGPRGGWLLRGNVGMRVLAPAVNGRPAYPGSKGHPPRDAWAPIEGAKGLTWHGLRHSHKTWMREDGIDDVLQREQLGHARSREIGEHYTHVTPAMRTRRLEALEERWDRCVSGRMRLVSVASQ